MKLTELDPRWAATNGVRDHVNFLCPVCKQHMIAVPIPPAEGVAWTMTGNNFENLTLRPSILHKTHYADGMEAEPRYCESHFFITNGQIELC